MYYCKDCGSVFKDTKEETESHSLKSEPFERYYVCPKCFSNNFRAISTTHCRCCGAKLNENQSEYCSYECKEKGLLLWEKERKRRKYAQFSPLNLIIKELEEFNLEHNTNYSYGQYISLKEKKKKCLKKRNI